MVIPHHHTQTIFILFTFCQFLSISFHIFTAHYGFNIKGGLDRPVIREDTGIFVAKIRPKGIASKHGGLTPGDRILEVSIMFLASIIALWFTMIITMYFVFI